MNYLVIWEEDDGDCTYCYWQIFDILDEAIVFMSNIEVTHNEKVVGFLESKSKIKDIDIPNIPIELIKKKKEEIKKRMEEQRKKDKIEWKKRDEKREREQYERLKKKFESCD